MANDRVVYNARTTYNKPGENYPYRTETLYRPDLAAMAKARVRIGSPVQVIERHGDTHWTNATYVRSELVDPELGMLRHVVIIDGRDHAVDESRIRPAKGN